jgi:glycosyltransferase involved in cell wall biosynthesis
VQNWVCWISSEPQREPEKNYVNELKARIQDLNISERVHFLGFANNIHSVLRAADIHCQPNSGPEPFGLAYVEALYAGLPVVTTSWGGAVEIVDEKCGVLVPPGDVDGLVKALHQLIENESQRKSLGAAGPARARFLCDPEKQVRILADRLQQLAARGSGFEGSRRKVGL